MSASIQRRQFLAGLMKLLVFIGFVFLSVPFIFSFSTSEDNEKQKAISHWVVTVPVTELENGKIKPLPWAGGLVWVYARTNKDLQLLENDTLSLQDPNSIQSEQPEEMKNNYRSADKKYFVFIPHENKKGCQVSLNFKSENSRFTEPCFNAKYDAAGRILKNSGQQEQQNLAVPNHVIENGILKIGIWMPKI